MQWLEILKINKGLELFFDVSVPVAINKQECFGHVLFVCSDATIRQHFSRELVNLLQPLAVENPFKHVENSALLSDDVPTISFCPACWDKNVRPSDIAATLTSLAPRDTLVLEKDTVELSSECFDVLCTAMDTFGMDIIVGKGPGANSIRLDLPEFTFMVCTSQETEELRRIESRFAYTIKIGREEMPEICEKAIIMRAQEEGCSLTDEACEHIAKCAGNDCSVAINYANRVIEYMRHYHSIGTQITCEHAKGVLGKLGVKPVSDNLSPAGDEVAMLLRDIRKQLNDLSTEVRAIKATLAEIQGEKAFSSLYDIGNALNRIEESLY